MSDRNAYLECISRIIARDDWSHFDDQKTFRDLLTTTLDYCIDKLTTLKTVTGSMAAFIGKVFAYSFFNIPNVSNALLFLLNVKQVTFESCLKSMPANTKNNLHLHQTFPQHLHHLINYKGLCHLKSRAQKRYMNCMPPPKHPVSGIKNPNGEWVRRWCGSDSNVFNSFLRHYINIVLKSLLKSDDACELLVLANCPGFTIILSHIYQIFQVSVNRISTEGSLQNGKASLPLKNKLSNMSNDKSLPPLPPPTFNINMKQSDMYYSSIIKIFKTVRDIAHCATAMSNDKSIDSISASLIKLINSCFKSIAKETSIYESNKIGLILGVVNEFVNYVENNSTEVSYLVDWEFWLNCNYMILCHSDHIQSLLKSFAFLFNTWDMIPDALSSSVRNGSQTEVKTHEDLLWIKNLNESFKVNFVNYLISEECFQMFFTHWNPLVRSYYIKLLVWRVVGINNYQSSSSINVTRKLQSHLTQSYEILLNFTMVNNGIVKLDYTPDSPLVNRKLGILPIGKDDYLIDSPSEVYLLATTLKSSELRKTHPFEIFDEAVYTCSTVPSAASEASSNSNSLKLNTKSLSKSKSKLRLKTKSSSSTNLESNSSTTGNKSNSLVSSLGRLLRLLSDEETPEDNDHTEDEHDYQDNGYGAHNAQVGNVGNGDGHGDRSSGSEGDTDNKILKRNGASFSSISTLSQSIRSRSSSPSILSLASAPTSFTESSSVKSDCESILTIDTLQMQKGGKTNLNDQQSYNIQPPELSKIPPEIIRPMFKFDIVVCHDTMNQKYQMIHSRNSAVSRGQFLNHHNQKHKHHQNQHQKQHRTNSPPCSPCLPSPPSPTTAGATGATGEAAIGATPSLPHKSIVPSTFYFPQYPQLPYISIFINSDMYNSKFYLNEENDGIFLEKINSNRTTSSESLLSLTRSTSASLCTRMDSVTRSKSTLRSSANAVTTLNDIKNPHHHQSSSPLQVSLFPQPQPLVKMINLGKSINELNIAIEEFRDYLNDRIETDCINDRREQITSLSSNDIVGAAQDSDEMNEYTYFKRIIPFLSVDSSNEMRLLNAS